MQSVTTVGIAMIWVMGGLIICQGRQAQDRAREVLVEGKYSNTNYGYSVIVPDTLKAHRMEAPAPQHGIALDLRDGRAWVNAEYDVALAGSVDAIAAGEAAAWASSSQLQSSGRLQTTLAGLPAVDVVLERNPNGSGINYVHFLLAFRAVPNEVGIVYTIGFSASAKNSSDEKTFSALVKSFRFLGVD